MHRAKIWLCLLSALKVARTKGAMRMGSLACAKRSLACAIRSLRKSQDFGFGRHTHANARPNSNSSTRASFWPLILASIRAALSTHYHFTSLHLAYSCHALFPFLGRSLSFSGIWYITSVVTPSVCNRLRDRLKLSSAASKPCSPALCSDA